MATKQAKPKGRKAKAASEQVASRKSTRISDLGAAKRKAAEDMSPSSIKKRKPEEEEGKLAEKPAVKKTKKAEEKKEKKKEEEEQVEAAVSTEKKPATKRTQQKQKKASKVPEPAEEKEEKAEKAEKEEKEEKEKEEEEEDDTTKALVQDLDSGDEESGGASLFEPGQDVGKAPTVAPPRKRGGAAAKGKTGSKAAAAAAVAAAATSGSSDEQRGGVVYIGRIPHGFFEHEMRSYFSQFGDIRRLRLSRNRRTGASKHYAFIEFSDADVAEIVAQTMDSYLLFGHILRCSVVPPERVPANLFAGANRRFKVVPWNRLAGRQLAEPKSESGWEAQVSRESKRRSKRASLLQEKIGYAYEAPSLKKPVAALKVAAAAGGEEGGSEEAGAEAEAGKTIIEAPATEDEVAVPAEKEKEEEEDKRTEAAAIAPKEAKASKAKKAKGKKSKAW